MRSCVVLCPAASPSATPHLHPPPPQTLAKIHQTYRIQYLKDVVLPRCLDDATYATLTSLMLFNNVDVLSALQADPRFLPRLFGALKDARPEAPEWGDLVAFLQVGLWVTTGSQGC